MPGCQHQTVDVCSSTSEAYEFGRATKRRSVSHHQRTPHRFDSVDVNMLTLQRMGVVLIYVKVEVLGAVGHALWEITFLLKDYAP